MKSVRDELSTISGSLIEISDEVVFYGQVTFTQLIESPVSKMKESETIPSVLNLTRLVANNLAPVTVTNFIHGQEGQTIKILGEGQTTIANNSTIKTNTGANKLLAANKVYTFTLFNAIWIEDS